MPEKLSSKMSGRFYIAIAVALIISFVFYSLLSYGPLKGRQSPEQTGQGTGEPEIIVKSTGEPSGTPGTPQKIGSIGVKPGGVEEVEIKVVSGK